jgi:hypothetical protein
MIRNSILDNQISKIDICNYNKLISKELKVSKDVLDALFERSTKISKFLRDRKYKKSLWNHILLKILKMKLINYCKKS